jgi:hypothetical protein
MKKKRRCVRRRLSTPKMRLLLLQSTPPEPPPPTPIMHVRGVKNNNSDDRTLDQEADGNSGSGDDAGLP